MVALQVVPGYSVVMIPDRQPGALSPWRLVTWHAGVVADSDALRSRRKRAHKRGDHSLCRHQPGCPVLPLAVLPDPDAGELDPRDELVNLAAMLIVAYRADPGNANLAKELRATLLSIPPPVEPDEDWFADMLSMPTLPDPPDRGQWELKWSKPIGVRVVPPVKSQPLSAGGAHADRGDGMDDGRDQAAIAAANTAAMQSMTITHGQEAAQVHAMPQAEPSQNMTVPASVPRAPRWPEPQDAA